MTCKIINKTFVGKSTSSQSVFETNPMCGTSLNIYPTNNYNLGNYNYQNISGKVSNSSRCISPESLRVSQPKFSFFTKHFQNTIAYRKNVICRKEISNNKRRSDCVTSFNSSKHACLESSHKNQEPMKCDQKLLVGLTQSNGSQNMLEVQLRNLIYQSNLQNLYRFAEYRAQEITENQMTFFKNQIAQSKLQNLSFNNSDTETTKHSTKDQQS